VDKRDFEVLRLLRIVDKSSDTLEVKANGKVLSKRRVRWRLGELKISGWIVQDASDRWILTSAGIEKLVKLDDWLITVERVNPLAHISDELRRTVPDASGPPLNSMATISGDLRSGIPHEDDTYLIHRNGAQWGEGLLSSVSYFEPPHGGRSSILLVARGDLPVPGDLLEHGSTNSSIQ
jgi:hypothetical protein